MMNKRGSDLLQETTIYVIIVVVFFSAMFLFVIRTSENIPFQEKVMARTVAIMIDSMQPGTTIEINPSLMAFIYTKKEIVKPLTIDKSKNQVVVKLGEEEGQTFRFFTDGKRIKLGGDGREKITIELMRVEEQNPS